IASPIHLDKGCLDSGSFSRRRFLRPGRGLRLSAYMPFARWKLVRQVLLAARAIVTGKYLHAAGRRARRNVSRRIEEDPFHFTHNCLPEFAPKPEFPF